MHSRLALAIAALAPLFVLVPGCGKKDETPTGTAPSAATTNITVNGGTVAVREEEGISRYSDEGPESGTVFTTKDVVILKAAEGGGAVLSRLGRGTGVNKKARRGPYYLVDFPTTGGMKPGWVAQSDVTTQAPQVVTTVTTTAPPATTTTAPPATTTGVRPPPIKIKPK